MIRVPHWVIASTGNEAMDRLHLFAFYSLGSSVSKLETLLLPRPHLRNVTLGHAIGVAEGTMSVWKRLDAMPKTAKACDTFYEALQTFVKLVGQDRTATEDECSQLEEEISKFNRVFEQECEDVHAFMLRAMGAYSVSALLEDACTHLSATAQKAVGDQTKSDFNEAGKCLLLDLHTACGFHAMRALEHEARFYHEVVTNVKMDDVPIGILISGDQKNYPGSGLRLQHTKEGGAADSPLSLIISLLANINKLYRCPIMHPEMTLDHEQAKQVFDLAANAISAIIDDGLNRFQAKKKAASTTAPIP